MNEAQTKNLLTSLTAIENHLYQTELQQRRHNMLLAYALDKNHDLGVFKARGDNDSNIKSIIENIINNTY